MAGGYFFNGVVHDEVRTDFGVYSQERGVYDPHEMSTLVKEDRAFQVQVVDKNDRVEIYLMSNSRDVEASLQERIERRGSTEINLFQSQKDPLMPGDYDNPHNAVVMYAEYALNHGEVEGIEMDVNWESVLEEENRGL